MLLSAPGGLARGKKGRGDVEWTVTRVPVWPGPGDGASAWMVFGVLRAFGP